MLIIYTLMLRDIFKIKIVNFGQVVQCFISLSNLPLGIVVNNAGIGNSGAFDWIATETIRKVMDVNFFGVVLVTKAMLPLLKRCKHSRCPLTLL
jgi:NAD(P)-dependent dehydrogenase (short-subunit alcohol dehydrogenase family)